MPLADRPRRIIGVMSRAADECESLAEELRLRYGAHYDVVAWPDPAAALAAVQTLDDESLALVLAFQHGVDALVGRGVFYSPAVSEAPAFEGVPVVVVGGGNSAGQAAVHLASYASSVTVLVRGATLAESMSEYLIREMDAAANIRIRYHAEVAEVIGDHLIKQVIVRDRNDDTLDTLDAGALFVLIGSQPHTDWLPDELERDQWGFIVTGAEGRPLGASNVPGVFAIGDVRAASVKRVASAVGQGAVVITQIHDYLNARKEDGQA